MTVEHLDHHVTLSAQARADIVWWHTFIREWYLNYITYRADSLHLLRCIGLMGLRGLLAKSLVSNRVGELMASMDIAVKELVRIVMAAAIWGRLWRGSHICCYCDNIAVVCDK